MSKIKISYWSDYVCPFCYIGEKRMKNVLKELNITDKFEFEFRAFELDPNSRSKGETIDILLSKKYHIPIEQAKANINYINKLGKEEGINMKFESCVHANTLNAHRLTKYIEKKGNYENYEKVIFLLYDAYFTKNLNLSDKNVLINIGQQVNCSKEEIEKLLNNSDFIKEVRNDENDGYNEGVHGVPYFVIDGKYVINGAQEKNFMKECLIKALNDKNGKMEKNMNNNNEFECGIDGCFIKK
jgi:predicted DsbA family dithiol-disulfide isomerase